MNLQVQSNDSALVARLKLLYLVPVFLICLLPGLLVVGWIEWGQFAFRMAWTILRYGNPEGRKEPWQ